MTAGGDRRGQGNTVTASPGLVLVIPGLEDEAEYDELPGYGSRPVTGYGAPAGRRRRRQQS